MQVKITNIHLRYEDRQTVRSVSHPTLSGVFTCLNVFSIRSQSVSHWPACRLYPLMRIGSQNIWMLSNSQFIRFVLPFDVCDLLIQQQTSLSALILWRCTLIQTPRASLDYHMNSQKRSSEIWFDHRFALSEYFALTWS